MKSETETNLAETSLAEINLENPGAAAASTTAADAATDPSGIAGIAGIAGIENGIVEVLKTIFDPEIPVNIYELGLIYDIDIQENGAVQVKMTLTAPGCPVAGTLPGEVRDRVESVRGVTSADVEVVWDPTWNPSMMSEAARLELGMF
jgi:FeS assembly SUF system protein